MHCSDCEERNIRLQNCYNVEQTMYVMNEYKIKKKLLMNICKKYNDIYCHVLSFLCNDCVSYKIDKRTFGWWCINHSKMIRYLLDANSILCQEYLYYTYRFDKNINTYSHISMVTTKKNAYGMMTPLHFALLTNLDMAYDIIFSNLYEESMMNKYCICSSLDFSIIGSTPLEIICVKYTYLLSVLITTQKITEKSITNDILKFCMRYNTKSLLIFLTSDVCSETIKNIINKTMRVRYMESFLYSMNVLYDFDTSNNIETILKLDVISIEFINHFARYNETFLHFIIKIGSPFYDDFSDHPFYDCEKCSKCIFMNKIFTALYETHKITRDLLLIRDLNGDNLLMYCCLKGLSKPTQIILSLDACDEEILLMQNSTGKNAFMLSLDSHNDNVKYALLNSNKITKNILNQRTTDNKTIYDMLNIVSDTYFRYKLNKIYYSE